MINGCDLVDRFLRLIEDAGKRSGLTVEDYHHWGPKEFRQHVLEQMGEQYPSVRESVIVDQQPYGQVRWGEVLIRDNQIE